MCEGNLVEDEMHGYGKYNIFQGQVMKENDRRESNMDKAYISFQMEQRIQGSEKHIK